MRDAEARGERGAVAVVPVDELDDAGGLAEGTDALLQAGAVHGVDEPDTAVRAERVRGALEELGLLGDPTEAEARSRRRT